MISDTAARLNDRIEELAHELLGEPNRSLSTGNQLRFGSKGSIAIEIAGPKRGRWYDHEQGLGGDGLELVRHVNRLRPRAAADWARDWLNLAHFGSPGEAQSSASAGGRPSPKASPRAGEVASKVANVIAGCQAVIGTAAERYLHSRGIALAAALSCLRFRPAAYGQYGALVALAVDADGEVHAVQQIYLTEDGHKAPLKVQKRTNKSHDDWSKVAAVRFPGAGPLVLAEGVETALSVWQATGRETWACLGIANIGRAPLPDDAPVVVARDGDRVGSKADKQLHRAIGLLSRQDREVSVATPPEGQDFNDVLCFEGEEAVRDLIAAAAPEVVCSTPWRSDLLCNEEGAARPVLANAIHALRKAPEWEGVLWHDEFATTTVARRQPPWVGGSRAWEDAPWSDRDDYLVTEWLQRQGIMVPASIAGQAVETVARDHRFHPVREYLDALQWDAVPRIETWLSTHLGAADTTYSRAVGSRWLTSAVARIYRPGAQADCALILEGPQGIRKSSALRILGQPWFTDRLSELGSKDAAMETRGVWIIEIAELDTMSRADVGTIKAFVSRTCDRFRPPYGKRLVDLPRQCVFAGTVNPDGGYLKDPTGGRRFWPIACGRIDTAALERDRDQLWAEARERFRAGQSWWLDTRELEELAAGEQCDRYQGDAWDDLIRNYVEGRSSSAVTSRTRWGTGDERPERAADHFEQPAPLMDVSVAEILEYALAIERGRWTQTDQNRVVRSLTSMGFERYRARRGRDREWRYRRHLREDGPPRGQGPTWGNLGPGQVRV